MEIQELETIMDFINVTSKRFYNGAIHSCTSQLNESKSANNLLREDGVWSTQENTKDELEYVIIDYGAPVPVDTIELVPSAGNRHMFPSIFRIESSIDFKSWEIIQSEQGFELGASETYVINIPLKIVRYVKLLIIKPEKNNTNPVYELSGFSAFISGAKEISASSSYSQENNAAKLIDGNDGTFWESYPVLKSGRENINIDLGNVYVLNRISLISTQDMPSGFPEQFFFEASSDGNIWTPLLSENNFSSEHSHKYTWNLAMTPVQFLRIEMETSLIREKTYGIRLEAIEVYAALMTVDHTHSIGDIAPHASVFQAGIVKLAKDGEETGGTAVQGNDRRLKEASTIFKGLVRLAEDGENENDCAIQASDSRLKPASELKYGIVRLAHDRENSPGSVVQGNDSRLQEATDSTFGIVKICPDGVSSGMGVVQGDDSRLTKATVDSFGISRLALDGEESPGSVVQGSDRRLKEATTVSKGIVELAEDGEDREGRAVQGNDRRLKEASTISRGIVELAEDGEDKSSVAVQGNDRRLREATTISKGIVELAEDGEDRNGVVVQGSDRRLKDATAESKGIVELATDGEDKMGVVVQGNDRRLKEATTVSKGIVELAEDGEAKYGIAVQGSDRRLKDATIQAKGIVRLADNGEDNAGVAVQGNDYRLNDASEESKGIVKLAGDGDDRAGVVVQGNDCRLRDATENQKGIVRFAGDGKVEAFAAVQSNDSRLGDASTVSKGIVQLADDGEDHEGRAVQGNDRRLKEATTISKGIVELAEDGEDEAGIVVQGNDRRLKGGTETDPGIVQFARNGESKSGLAVQSDDIRLFDKREPLPHTHNYADKIHDFSDHIGTISIGDDKNHDFEGIAPPPDNAAIIHAKNTSDGPGSIAVLGISDNNREPSNSNYGVLGHGKFIGVRGQSAGNSENGAHGCGILGVSRFGAGGVFTSEHSYSVVVDGYGDISEFDNSLDLVGNGNALKVRGRTDINGRLYITNDDKNSRYPANIVEMFEVEDSEFINVGDILAVSPNGKSMLCRSNESYLKSIIGIVAGNPTVILNDKSGKKLYPVALAGKAMCNVDARHTPVKPGDLIVASDTHGCGMAGKMDSFEKIGTVIGKALDGLESGIGMIPVFISRL